MGHRGHPRLTPSGEILPCNSKTPFWAQGAAWPCLSLWGTPYFASHHSLSSSLLSTGDIVTLSPKDRPHLGPHPSHREPSCLLSAGENPLKSHYALSDPHPGLLCLTPMWKTRSPSPPPQLTPCWCTFHLKLHCWPSSPLLATEDHLILIPRVRSHLNSLIVPQSSSKSHTTP